MQNHVDLKIDLKKFSEKMKAELQKHDAKIGILNEKQHNQDEFSDATLGAVHEFGSLSGKIPSRSFLRLTSEVKAKEMSQFVSQNEDKIAQACIDGKMKLVIAKLAAKFEAFVHECFETEGWGKWQELADSTLKAREKKRFLEGQGGVKILQDTGALERSITHEVT